MNGNLNLCIEGRFRLVYRLFQGGNCVMYLGIDDLSKTTVFIKAESFNIMKPSLLNEAVIYRKLNELYPNVFVIARAFETINGICYLVLDHHGVSLSIILKYCSGYFSPKTILMGMDQILNQVEALHKINYAHRKLVLKHIIAKGSDLCLVDMSHCILCENKQDNTRNMVKIRCYNEENENYLSNKNTKLGKKDKSYDEDKIKQKNEVLREKKKLRNRIKYRIRGDVKKFPKAIDYIREDIESLYMLILEMEGLIFYDAGNYYINEKKLIEKSRDINIMGKITGKYGAEMDNKVDDISEEVDGDNNNNNNNKISNDKKIIRGIKNTELFPICFDDLKPEGKNYGKKLLKFSSFKKIYKLIKDISDEMHIETTVKYKPEVYDRIRREMEKMFIEFGYRYDNLFDWIVFGIDTSSRLSACFYQK